MGGVCTTEEAPSAEKPRPQVFALMRNSHEVIRGAMRDLDDAIALEDDGAALAAFGPRWEEFLRFQGLHAAMEDGVRGRAKGMFAFLDEQFADVAKEKGLRLQHRALHEKEAAVGRALKRRSAKTLRDAWPAYREANEAHLAKEEEVMMPKVAELVKAGHNMPLAIRSHMLPAAGGDAHLSFFIEFAMRTLEKHHGGMPRARVFAHALAAAAGSEAEWARWRGHVQAGLSADAYANLGREIELDKWGDGAYPEPQPWMAKA